MAQVLDEFILEFGIDHKKFDEGARDAMESFRKTKDNAETFAKDVEAQSMKLADVFGIVKKGAMGIVGAFVGGEAAAFIDHIIGMDAATGRMAKTIGTSVESLGIWQSMIRQVGGSAEEATSAMSALQSAINNVRVGNGMFDNQFGFLLTKIGGAQGKNADQIMRQLQSYFAGEIGAGRMSSTEAATQMSWVPGMNQSMINLLLSDFKKIEQAAREVGGATRETAEAAQLLQSRFSLMIQAFERFGASLIPIIDLLMKPLKDWGMGDVKSVLPKMDFEPGSVMDRLDKFLWGSSSGGGASFSDRFGAVGSSGRSSAADREAWIRSMAIQLGIDPDVAMRVTRSEGFNSYKSSIPGEQSFGDFQLNMNPGSMGDEFFKKTGLDPRDPANEKAMDLFALKRAAAVGWDPNGKGFHGATNSGIGNWQGIGARGSAAARNVNNSRSSSSTSSSEVNIGNITVNAPNATDADGIAKEIGPAMKRSAITSPANSSLV